jgi:hypothetical protein
LHVLAGEGGLQAGDQPIDQGDALGQEGAGDLDKAFVVAGPDGVGGAGAPEGVEEGLRGFAQEIGEAVQERLGRKGGWGAIGDSNLEADPRRSSAEAVVRAGGGPGLAGQPVEQLGARGGLGAAGQIGEGVGGDEGQGWAGREERLEGLKVLGFWLGQAAKAANDAAMDVGVWCGQEGMESGAQGGLAGLRDLAIGK